MFSKSDLDQLITEEAAPAVSLLLPTHAAGREIRQDPIRLRGLVDRAARRLGERGMRGAEVERLLEPARTLVADEAFWREQEDGLAVFLAPGLFRFLKSPTTLPEEVVIGRHFHLRHLLPALADDDDRFRLLAVSARRARLFDADRYRMTERRDIALPQGVETVAAETTYENTRQAAPATRGRAGTQGGVAKTQNLGADPEALRKAELIEYLRRVADAVDREAKAGDEPIVLAAQPEIQGHFRALQRLPTLAADGLAENPDGLDDAELHRRAQALAESRLSSDRASRRDRLNEALNDGSGRATSEIADIVPAAREGRVDTLFLAGGAHLWGRIDDAGAVLAQGEEDGTAEDLLDDATAATLLKGGRVEILPPDRLAGHAAAAILRY